MLANQPYAHTEIMDEDEVIRILNAGQVTQAVFDWFYRAFYPMMLRLARQFNIPVPDALDLLVEVTGDMMMKMAAGKYPEMYNLRGFLHKVLHNQMCTYLRNKGRRNLVEFESNFEHMAAIPLEETDERKEALIARLYCCIDKLPMGERAPLRLWHLEELSYEEIAAHLNITKQSAKTQVNRAMARLKTCMSNNSTQH